MWQWGSCYPGYMTWVVQKHPDSCLWGAGKWCHQLVPRRKAGLTRLLCCLNRVWSQVDPGLSHVENPRSDPRLWYERGRILSPFRYRSETATASVRPHAHYRNMAPKGAVHTVDFSAQRGCTTLEKHSGFLPEIAPHLFTGSAWYCSSAALKWIGLSCNTTHNPWTGVVLFFEPLKPDWSFRSVGKLGAENFGSYDSIHVGCHSAYPEQGEMLLF